MLTISFLIIIAMTDSTYFNASRNQLNRSVNQHNQQGQQDQNSNKETLGEKTRRWKNKFMNFLYERKGYKRVNTTEDTSTKMSNMLFHR